MSRRITITTEARAMAALALPVVADQIGLMSMSFVDTIMVGRLGKDALGAVGIGGAVYFFHMVFAYGVVSSVGPTVAHAFGAGDREEIERSVGQAFWLALLLTGTAMLVIFNVGPILTAMGQAPELVVLAERFVHALGFGVLAALGYAVLRAFVVGLGRTRVTMMISIVGACVNAVADYLLIYGRLGFPRLGVAGAGYATSIVQWVMLGAALVYVLRDRDLRSYRFFRHILRLDLPLLKRLLRLGVPIGLGSSMENGVFAFTSILMGQIGTVALASHQVAINVAAFTFMVPLGISTAATTRVGQAMGRGEPRAAALAGWTAIGLGVAFMSCTALAFIFFPGSIIAIYSDDRQVLAYAAGLLTIAGAFQIVDGMQVVAMGALRGLKDTTRPLLVNIFAYWVIGLPIGYTLAFLLGQGGNGLWWGLSAGLAVAAILHSLRFRKLTARHL